MQVMGFYLLVRLQRGTAERDLQVSCSRRTFKRQEQNRTQPVPPRGWQVKGQPEAPALGVL